MTLKIKKQLLRLFSEQLITQSAKPKQSTIRNGIPDKHVDLENTQVAWFEMASNQLNPHDIKHVLRDYADIFDKEPDQENRLSFPNQAEAIAFFHQQAEIGRSFLFKKSGEDYLVYSDGHGHFFQGSQDQLDAFLHKTMQDQKLNHTESSVEQKQADSNEVSFPTCVLN